MSFTGTDVIRLTTNTGQESAPAVSKDGSTIAFFRFGGSAGSGIYTMSATGTGEARVRAMSSAGTIAFDPDGTRLAFINLDSTIGPTNEIFLMNVDGTGLVQFTSGAFANGRGLSWTPNGSTLAFVSNTPSSGVYFVNLAGGPRQRIADGDMPVFSPDGTLIMYRRTVSGNTVYFVSNLDGSAERSVLNLQGVDQAVFHPNGTSLIFDRGTPQSQIYIINSVGTTTNLSNNTSTDRWPAVRGSP
jgi:Tol biopolymer transport system component